MKDEVLNNKQLLSVVDLQHFSGESESCWRKRLLRGEIPYLKFGSNVRIQKSDLQKFIEARMVRGGNDE